MTFSMEVMEEFRTLVTRVPSPLLGCRGRIRRSPEAQVLISTDVLSRGIDVPSVTVVWALRLSCGVGSCDAASRW